MYRCRPKPHLECHNKQAVVQFCIKSWSSAFLSLVLSAVTAINAAIEKQGSEELVQKLQKENAGLTGVDDFLGNRYLEHLISVKQEKAQVKNY